MDAWPAQLGLHVLAVALTPLVGLLLVFWGLCGDRSNGRPRCPECWYDMRGSLPKLECPEYGHDARQERRRYMNRRCGKRIALGIVLMLLSLTVAIVWVCAVVVGFQL